MLVIWKIKMKKLSLAMSTHFKLYIYSKRSAFLNANNNFSRKQKLKSVYCIVFTWHDEYMQQIKMQLSNHLNTLKAKMTFESFESDHLNFWNMFFDNREKFRERIDAHNQLWNIIFQRICTFSNYDIDKSNDYSVSLQTFSHYVTDYCFSFLIVEKLTTQCLHLRINNDFADSDVL